MLEVLEPALLTTVQDGGRHGWQAFGVPVSGPMDAFALQAANLLVCNPPDAAAIEIGFTSALFIARKACLIALTGVGFTPSVGGIDMPLWTSIYVRGNYVVRISKSGAGNWAYLAVQGGIQTPVALGSRSTYLRARLGVEAAHLLQAGDMLPAGTPERIPVELAGRRIVDVPVSYSEDATIRVIPGPQYSHFTTEGLQTLFSSTYTISTISDRSGYRLDGPPIERANKAELVSEGMACGCIQVPASGLPIVMQVDCPTVGGYPKIASVISVDRTVLAQVPFGSGRIRFQETTIEQAQSSLRAMMRDLPERIIQPEVDDYSW